MGAILAVGPRKLPNDGLVRVWVDGGSGSGHDSPYRPGEHVDLWREIPAGPG